LQMEKKRGRGRSKRRRATARGVRGPNVPPRDYLKSNKAGGGPSLYFGKKYVGREGSIKKRGIDPLVEPLERRGGSRKK